MLRKVCLASPLYMIVRTICEGASVNYSLRGHEIGGVRLIRWRVTTSGGGGSPLVTTHSAISPTLTNKVAISHSNPSSNNWELSSARLPKATKSMLRCATLCQRSSRKIEIKFWRLFDLTFLLPIWLQLSDTSGGLVAANSVVVGMLISAGLA